jgi:2-keto-4-pentenoate hydratase/2-oxohepta-3-ene-1,7-dioic acid hydratase in catechol pathway
MRPVRLALFDDYRVGVVDGDQIRDVSDVVAERDGRWPWAWMPRLIADFGRARRRLEDAAQRAAARSTRDVNWLPPIPWPGQLVAAAANYHEHAAEMAARPGSNPNEGLQGEVFLKAPSSIISHGATVCLPNVPGREIHHEAELGVIVGRPMRHVPVGEALDYVFGYTCLMDLTVRGRGDRSRRKSYAGFTPLGPWLVTADEVPDPQDLAIKLWVNGDVRQNGTTREMVYSVADLLAYASTVMPLYPGDVLASGTPSGVGPIGAGDRVEMELERIGRLTVDIAAPPPGTPVGEVGLGSPKS